MAIIKGTNSEDTIIVLNNNADLALGLLGNDEIDVVANNGNETLSGGLGNDKLFVNVGDRAFGDFGNDTLKSESQEDAPSNNYLFGGSGNDSIFPDQNDWVSGGSGSDIIYAGIGGNNTLRGGFGNDIFWLANVERPINPNIITDFNPIEDILTINLETVDNFNDLVITTNGNNVIINAPGDNIPLVTIENIKRADLNSNNILINNLTNNNNTAPLDNIVKRVTNIKFIGQDVLDDNGLSTNAQGKIQFLNPVTGENTIIGGLSGITYDKFQKVYYAISDDRSNINPARFYTLNINLNDGKLDNGDVNITNVTSLLNTNGDPFPANSLDPEGIAFSDDGTVFISSEGDANNLISPFVREFSLAGGELENLPIPNKFIPQKNQTGNLINGIRQNLALESLTLTPDERFLFTANENALTQDGNTATNNIGSLVRIVQYDLTSVTPQIVKEFIYKTDTIPKVNNSNSADTTGLVDLLAIDNTGTLLTLERTFTSTGGYSAKLYEINLKDAPDISNIASLANSNINPVNKRLLLDLSTLKINLDNIEGMTLGAILPNGKRSLIIVSDDNFDSFGAQNNQFLAFELEINQVPTVEINQSPTVNDAIFPSILEHSPEKTIVGTVIATDADSEKRLKYAITNGNLDLDNDGRKAFKINKNTGEISVNDSGDLDFEKLKKFRENPNFKLEVTVTDDTELTDTANITIGLIDQPEFGFDKNKNGKNGLLRLRESTTIEFSISSVKTNKTNDILVFNVDDEDGNIWQRDENGRVIEDVDGNPLFFTPNDNNYLTQIISHTRFQLGLTQTAFSVLSSNNPSGLPRDFSFQNITRNLQISGGSHIGFLLIADGTVQDLKNGVNREVFFSNLNGLEVDNFSSGNLQLKFKDEKNGKFDSLVLNVKNHPIEKSTKGTGLQNKVGLEVIDLRGQTDSKVNISVNSEAAFSNFVGFYQVVNEEGGISRSNGTICRPGDADYIQLAVNQRLNISLTQSVSVLNNQTLIDDSILVPFIVANDINLNDGFNINNVFFPFLGANSDQAKHIKLLGDNMFGFEDLVNGGDQDFDDMIITVKFDN